MASIRPVPIVVVLVALGAGAATAATPKALPAVTAAAAAAWEHTLVDDEWARADALVLAQAADWTPSGAPRTDVGPVRTAVDAIPPLPGDPGLRDAVLASLDEMAWEAGPAADQIATLLGTSPPDAAADAGMEALWGTFVERQARANAGLSAAEAAFAARFGIPLVAPTVAAPAPFLCPELVPAGSNVPAQLQAEFVLRYRNYAWEEQKALVSALRDFSAAAADLRQFNTALAALRTRVVAVQARAGALEGWRGDTRLKDALGSACTTVLGIIDGDLTAVGAQTATLSKQGTLSGTRVVAINDGSQRATYRVNGALDVLARAFPPFDASWHLDAYQRWRQTTR